MDAKLETYRLKKRRKAVFNKIKDKFLKMVSFSQVRSESKTEHVIQISSNSSQNEIPEQSNNKEIYLHDITPVPTDDEEDSCMQTYKPEHSLQQKTCNKC